MARIRVRRYVFDPPEEEKSAFEVLAQLADSMRFTERFVEFAPEQEVYEPFHQLDELCARCQIPIYESGNHVKVCLICGACSTTVGSDAQAATRAQPFRARRPRRKKPAAPTSRSYKVQGAHKRPTPEAAARAQQPLLASPPGMPEYVWGAALHLGFTAPLPTIEVVQQRRRFLALEHHPDRGGAAGVLASFNEAADTLIEWLTEQLTER